MNKILFMTIIAALLVSGCSDKDDTTSGALEKVMESSKGAMSDMKDKAGEAMDGAKSMASDATDTVGDAASDAMDSASNMASDAADAAGDATDNAMEGASAMVADAKTAAATRRVVQWKVPVTQRQRQLQQLVVRLTAVRLVSRCTRTVASPVMQPVSPARPNWVTRMPGRRVLLRVLTPW